MVETNTTRKERTIEASLGLPVEGAIVSCIVRSKVGSIVSVVLFITNGRVVGLLVDGSSVEGAGVSTKDGFKEFEDGRSVAMGMPVGRFGVSCSGDTTGGRVGKSTETGALVGGSSKTEFLYGKR